MLFLFTISTEASHLSTFSSVERMPLPVRRERKPTFPYMRDGQWHCSQSTCPPTFQPYSNPNLFIGVLSMHTIKFWVRPVDGLITKHFTNDQIAEVFWWLNYLQTHDFKYEHTHIDR